MIKDITGGWIFWNLVRIKYAISYNKVVIVLTGEDERVDKSCLKHIGDFAKRKHAKEAIIFCLSEYYERLIANIEDYKYLRVYCIESKKMRLMYRFYGFMKFFDNIVFTYTDCPRDNYLGRYLRETDITPEDAACLALYHLRYVPSEA